MDFSSTQGAWYSLRLDARLFAEWVSALIEKKLRGAPLDKKARQHGAIILESLQEGIKFAPNPPSQIPENLKDDIQQSTQKWAQLFDNFCRQITQFGANLSDRRAGQLAIVNFKEAMKTLKTIWETLDRLFQVVPDYFEAQELKAKEVSSYRKARSSPLCLDTRSAWSLRYRSDRILTAKTRGKTESCFGEP